MSQVYAVATIFDFANSHAAGPFWEKVGHVFDTAGVELTRLPHISWHVAMEYELENLAKELSLFAMDHPPFSLRVAGIGVFSGENPVVYLPVTKTERVARMQRLLWEKFARFSTAINQNYDPDLWIPHITLTSAGAGDDAICQIISELAFTAISDEILADHLAIIYKDDAASGVLERYPLLGRPT